jgi:hypothetical protein
MILELIVPGRGSSVSSVSPSHKGHRHPVDHLPLRWLYFRFSLSFREVEELLERGGLRVRRRDVGQGPEPSVCALVAFTACLLLRVRPLAPQ